MSPFGIIQSYGQNQPKANTPFFHNSIGSLKTSWNFNDITKIKKCTPVPIKTPVVGKAMRLSPLDKVVVCARRIYCQALIGEFQPQDHIFWILHDIFAKIGCLPGWSCFSICHNIFYFCQDSRVVEKFGLPPGLAVEFPENNQRFGQQVYIIAVWRVIFQYLHDVFNLFVRLLLVKWFIGGLLSDHLGRISKNQEKGQGTLVLHRLEKRAELSVFIDLVLKSEAVSISREDVELFILPIVEKLKEIYKLLTSFFIFRFLKSEYGMISSQAI